MPAMDPVYVATGGCRTGKMLCPNGHGMWMSNSFPENPGRGMKEKEGRKMGVEQDAIRVEQLPGPRHCVQFWGRVWAGRSVRCGRAFAAY
eukprot:gene11971-biopygen1874